MRQKKSNTVSCSSKVVQIFATPGEQLKFCSLALIGKSTTLWWRLNAHHY
jgi:hypothetical protein